MVMVIYQTLNEIKKLMNSISPLFLFLHSVREWQVYKDGKMGACLSFLTANISAEKALPEFVAGDESAVQICNHTDLLTDACTDGNSTVTCAWSWARNSPGFWMKAGRRSVLPQLQPALIAGSVTGRVLGWNLPQSRRQIRSLLSHPHTGRHVSSSAPALSSVCNAHSSPLCSPGTHLPSLSRLVGLL